MGWFQLDPQSIASRAREAGADAPSFGTSLLRGTLGFTLVSLAGFAPWALFGGLFKNFGGEIGMYIACAVAFVGLSGLLLHKLIIGPGSLSRFYKLFGIGFTLYSVAWIASWISLSRVGSSFAGIISFYHLASIVGLFTGTLIMGVIFARAFEACPLTAAKTVLALFSLNAVGYFVGGITEHDIAALKEMNLLGVHLDKRQTFTVAMMSWGVFYGLGLGAGLALAFYFCQAKARALLKS